MSDFCPDGFVSMPNAIARAAERWFPEQINALEGATERPSEASESAIDAAVRAFSQPLIPDDCRRTFEAIASPTVQRLRNFLHQGKLVAFYFDNNGSRTVPRDFWATADADGVIETGVYWPFGPPSRKFEQRPNYALFLSESQLDEVFNERLSKKRPFPGSKMPELVAALRRIDDLPNRGTQLAAMRDLAEFREFNITHAIFREAAKHLPRNVGRKSRQKS